MKQPSPKTIFLSSTYEDLKEYREKSIDVIVSLKQIYEGMEFFGADNRTSLSLCLDKLKYCQIYVAIIGMRYGSVEKNSGKSYTEIEYEKAQELGLPCYIYIIDEENALIPPKFVERGENAEKLEAFKNKLRSNHVCKKFTTVESLAESLQHDLPNAIDSLNSMTEKNEEEYDEEMNNELEDYKKLQKFLLRPVKYHGTTVTISMKLLDEINGWRIKGRIVRAFGLSDGDTASCEVLVMSPNDMPESINLVTRTLNMYCSGNVAEWLIDNSVQAGDIIKGKVKLMSAKLTNITDSDEAEIIVGIVLSKGIDVIRVENELY